MQSEGIAEHHARGWLLLACAVSFAILFLGLTVVLLFGDRERRQWVFSMPRHVVGAVRG